MPDRDARIPLSTIAAVVRHAIADGWLDADQPALLLHDLSRLRDRVAAIRAAFPPDTRHTVAIKANPLVALLRQLVATGVGLEAASFEEVELALAAGCPSARVVFDSPAKTVDELRRALQLGLTINADNLDELGRIAALVGAGRPRGEVGLRINPRVGAGAIADTSTADETSKFGVPLGDDPAPLVEAFARHRWLTGVHVHSGSQGLAIDRLTAGVGRVLALADTINAALGRDQVRTLDLGGGLPVAYRPDDAEPSFDAYARALGEALPTLFDGRYRLITEFGRAVHAHGGWAVSRVEYVKRSGAGRIATIHLGADLLVRRAYRPEQWFHELAVLDAAGHPKATRAAEPWTVAGPLCFSGDVLGRDLALPPIEAGDLIVIRDVGAYTASMWSRYCSRAMPAMLGYEGGDPPTFELLRRRERPEDLVRFWS